VRRAEKIAQRPSKQHVKILNGYDRSQQEIEHSWRLEHRCYHTTIQMKGLTDIPGIRVGHASDYDGITGCTVILCEAGAAAGVDVRAPPPAPRSWTR